MKLQLPFLLFDYKIYRTN